MTWWQIASTLLAFIVAGIFLGVLVSYLITRFFLKRKYTLFTSLKLRSARKPRAPEGIIINTPADRDELYQGRVELEIAAASSFTQILRLQAYIHKISDLRLVSVGGTAAGNTTLVVESDKPLPLVSILSNIPLAKDVVKTGQHIRMSLENIQFA